MLKLFFMTALMQLPFGLFIGGASFLLSKGLLKFRHPAIAAITKLVILLASFAATIGLVYGLLRFNGVITFPTDNFVSWNWFDASYRDEGFALMYFCCSALIGISSAILVKWNARMSEA